MAGGGFDPWIAGALVVALVAGFVIGRMWPRRSDSRSRLEMSSRRNASRNANGGRVEAAGKVHSEVVEIRVGSHAETYHLSEAAISDIRAGKLINAIKRVRDETGLGLREAKNAVEDYVRKNGL